MSELQKTTKININLKSSGTFLNINKPKYLSLGKSCNINNIKVKKKDLNISQDSFRIENITRQTESSSKDEIIKALKERLTILEKKVKILEIEKKDNSIKTNILNLSHGNNKSMNKEMKLNIKVFKNKKKFTNVLNLSHSEIYKKRDKNYLYKSKKSFNIDIDKKNKHLNKNLNFFNSINTSGYHTNIDKIKSKMKISKSVSKYKNFTIIPKNTPKKKIFIDVLKHKKVRFEAIKNEKLDNVKTIININNSIPKAPNKEKPITKSEKIKKYEAKLNEVRITNFYETKKKLLVFNKYSRLKTYDLNNMHHINLENNFDNNKNTIPLKIFKNKLENIKNKKKKLLEFYSDYKINKINCNLNNNNN